MKELGIIIPVLNNFKLTASCLANIFKGTYPKDKIQIVLIDNNSTDLTESFLTYLVSQGEPIIYLRQKENLNFVKSLNLGLTTLDTPFIMLLNNDAFVEPDCIEKMMQIIKSSSIIGIVGAMEYLPNGQPSKTKPFIYFKENELLDPELKDLSDLGLDETIEFVDVDIAGSACCIMRRKVFEVVGYFDERFIPCMFEQEDYFLRTKIAGFRIVMPRFAKFTHTVGATTAFNTPYYQQVIKENKKKFLEKWLGDKN